MANRFANLEGSKKISEDFQNINIGFDRVQAEMDTKGTPADAQAKADAAKEAAIAAAAADLAAHKARGADEHPTAKGNAAGFMSAADKLKLDTSTGLATPYTLLQRDGAGRAKVAAPAATDDIARKAETDAVQTNLDSHAADTVKHVTQAEHDKLQNIQAGAEVNQNAFAKVNDVEASSKTDTVTFVGGTGIVVTTNPSNKQVTVTATGTATPGAHAPSHVTGGSDVIPDAVTGGASGLMSGSDAKFVREDGESKTGAQAKADAAKQAAIDVSLPRAGGALTGPLRISSWGDISASSGGYVLYGHNCYLDAAGVVYRYRNTHANMGARGIVFRLGAGLQGAWMFDMGTIATTAGASFTPILKRILNTDDYSAIVQDYIRQPGYAATTGTATAYTAALDPAPASLPDGFGITIVPHVANGANPTLNVNGLGAVALKDQKGVAYAAGKLVAGRPYTFRKVGTDFLADSGSSSGTAQPAQVLAGETFGNDNGDQVGTMPNRGALGTITPGTTNQPILEGYTLGGEVLGDPDLIASNIKNGVNIYGVVGNFAGSISPGAGPIWRRTTYITVSQSTPLEIVGIVFNVSGTIRISFGLRSDSSGGGRAQIYKNGVAFGTLRSNNSTSVTTYTEDITFASGDRISVYLWTGGAGSGTLETITYGSTLFTIAKE
ncbi:hypothetical protein QP794_02530 [Paenibacillus sp. UMB7766-LJ446]|uniref:hypothetical protein n=1 Tax=Paenibacillus sp. UMB7766-LJ446 TaxID=3046313 RepID=UPI00254BC9C6|nr:hypothetical protein [Paenibacillus sp. UMB7766-LJ446]MDK8188961.1 hypothetical protein [Paenibacillus sp. UMB7766-LJ446]